MASSVGPGDVEKAVAKYGQAVFAAAAAGSSSATNIVPLSGEPAGGYYVNGLLRFVTGALAGQEQVVSANTTGGFTVPAFTAAPAAGDLFIVISRAVVQAIVSENIAQIGGKAQTGADWTPLLQDAAAPSMTKGETFGATQQFVVVGGTDGNTAQPWTVHDNGAAVVGPVQVTANNSSTPLGANAQLVLNLGPTSGSASCTGFAYSDQSGSFVIEHSSDDVNYYPIGGTYTVTGGVATAWNVSVLTDYMRIVYTNGPTAQTVFALEAYYNSIPSQSIQAAGESGSPAPPNTLQVGGLGPGGALFALGVLNDGSVETSPIHWGGGNLTGTLGDNADGVAPATYGLPLMLSRLTGWTGSAWSRLKLAASGALQTKDDSTGATGAAVPTSAMQVGGSDGTDLRTIATDTTGAVKLAAGTNTIGYVHDTAVEAAIGTTGNAVPTNVLQVGGSDGTDLRTLLTDTDGTLHSIIAKLGALSPVVAFTPIANVAEAAATAFGAFTATQTGMAKALVYVSAAATFSLTGLGVTAALNGGTALSAGVWYGFEFPVINGQSYSFQVSAAANVSLAVLYNSLA